MILPAGVRRQERKPFTFLSVLLFALFLKQKGNVMCIYIYSRCEDVSVYKKLSYIYTQKKIQHLAERDLLAGIDWGWVEGYSAATCSFTTRCPYILHTEPLNIHPRTWCVVVLLPLEGSVFLVIRTPALCGWTSSSTSSCGSFQPLSLPQRGKYHIWNPAPPGDLGNVRYWLVGGGQLEELIDILTGEWRRTVRSSRGLVHTEDQHSEDSCGRALG